MLKAYMKRFVFHYGPRSELVFVESVLRDENTLVPHDTLFEGNDFQTLVDNYERYGMFVPFNLWNGTLFSNKKRFRWFNSKFGGGKTKTLIEGEEILPYRLEVNFARTSITFEELFHFPADQVAQYLQERGATALIK